MSVGVMSAQGSEVTGTALEKRDFGIQGTFSSNDNISYFLIPPRFFHSTKPERYIHLLRVQMLHGACY